VRNGVLHARGRIVLFTDADLSSPIEEIPKLLQALAAAPILPSDHAGCRPNCKPSPVAASPLFGRIFNLLLAMHHLGSAFGLQPA